MALSHPRDPSALSEAAADGGEFIANERKAFLLGSCLQGKRLTSVEPLARRITGTFVVILTYDLRIVAELIDDRSEVQLIAQLSVSVARLRPGGCLKSASRRTVKPVCSAHSITRHYATLVAERQWSLASRSDSDLGATSAVLLVSMRM